MPVIPIFVSSPDDPGADTLWTTGNTCNTNFSYLDNRITIEIRGRLWLSTINYVVGDVVSENGFLYVSLISDINQPPSGNPTYWKEVGGSSGATGGGLWLVDTTYDAGDIVSESEIVYVSKVGLNIGNTPSTSAAEWEPVGSGGGVVVEPVDAKKILVADDAGAASDWKGTTEDEADIDDANFIDATFARAGADAYKWTRHLKRHTIENYLEDFEGLGSGLSNAEYVVNTTSNIIITVLPDPGPFTLNLNHDDMPNDSMLAITHILIQSGSTWPGLLFESDWNMKFSDQIENFPFDVTAPGGTHIVSYFVEKNGSGTITTFGNIIGSNFTDAP